MKPNLTAVLIFLSLFIFSGCSMMNVDSKVTPFFSDDFKSYKTYKIAPVESQTNSLAFKQYSKTIKEKLSKVGLVESEDKAELIIYFNYGISGSQKIVGSTPVYGQISGETTITSTAYTKESNADKTKNTITHISPSYGVIGTTPYSITEFTRFLTVDIFNIETKKKVYESRTISVGETDDINEVIPYLINAVFNDFPGKNGETMKIEQKAK